MIKKYTLFTILFIFSSSCAFKPLYKQTNDFHPHKIKIIIKSKENYENSLSMMKILLNQKLNKKNSKNSSLKLIVSINRSVSNIGVNKDLNSYARLLQISVNYSFYDRKGQLLSGNLNGDSSFNYTTNNYANLISMEDATNKLIKSLSDDLSNLILADSIERSFIP
tara:strand:+ start:72 stop:569 length:498 start_codon:yes stop_codon:yes gene_type:complete